MHNSQESKKILTSFWSPYQDENNSFLRSKILNQKAITSGHEFLDKEILEFEKKEINKKDFIESTRLTVKLLLRMLEVPLTDIKCKSNLFAQIPLN